MVIELFDTELTQHFMGAPKHHSILEGEARPISLERPKVKEIQSTSFDTDELHDVDHRQW